MKKIILSALAAATMAFSAPAIAQDAKSLDQLLQDVQKGRSADSAANKAREREFQAARNQQAQLLSRARSALTAEERKAEQLEETFQANERKIAELRAEQREKAANLNELFGVLQQYAGDFRNQLRLSLISSQFPGRAEKLDTLIEKTAEGSVLPNISEIRFLWSTMLQQAIESGDTDRYTASVVDGENTVDQEVIRIGTFGAVSEGHFLEYNLPAGADEGQLVAFAQQPDGAIAASANNLATGSGNVDFAVDPLRGQLFKLLGQSPNLQERVGQGGVIGYIILSLGAIAIIVTIIKLIYLVIVGGKMKAQMKATEPRSGNPLGRVLQTYHDNKTVDVETLELKMDEAILKETPKLEFGNGFVKIVSVVAPLLGLFGTVTGMINTFQAITLFGTGDPKVMAGGISQALVTTVLGLTVAIPTVLLHAFLAGRTKSLIHILEEQAAGIIAVHAEKENTSV
ncbi:MAG: MotA/TolQ/ExbB proton channel family protein [Pseudomonadota bacterium]